MNLEGAIGLAYKFHEGQLDKKNQPFIGHPLRVMARLAMQGYSGEILQAAVLHDIIEDTECTAHELKLLGCSPNVVQWVVDLSRVPSETYKQYIDRVKNAGGASSLIKFSDILDNMDRDRIGDDPELLSMVKTRYIWALGHLGYDRKAAKEIEAINALS